MHNRINNWQIFILVGITGLIQATGLGYLAVSGAKPDALFILVVFFSLFGSKADALKVAVVSGLIEDLTSSAVFGSNAVSFMAIALILNHYQPRFYKEKVSMQILVSFISYIFASMLAVILNTAAGIFYEPYQSFLAIIFKSAAYASVVSPAAFFILEKLLYGPKRLRFGYFLR